MNYTRHVLSAGLLLLFAQGTAAHAQIETLRTRTAIASPDSTIDKLTKRVEALESTVAALQQKLAFIKSVSPLVLDAGGDLQIRATQISFDANTAMSLRAGTTLGVTAGSDLNLRGFSNASLRAGAQMSVEAGTILDLKGSSIRHNGVTMTGPAQ
jgi:hypothetical protein